MKKILPTLCVLLSMMVAYAQPAMDEVELVRREIEKADSSRYDHLFNQLYSKCRALPAARRMAVAEQIVATAEQANNPVLLAYAYRHKGNTYLDAKQNAEGLNYLKKAYTLCQENNQKRETGIMALRLGRFYFDEDFFTEALERFYEADHIFVSLNDTSNLFETSYLSSLINYRMSNYAEAIVQAQTTNSQFARLRHLTKGDSINAMSANNTIGLSAFQLGNFELGLQAFEKAEIMAKQMKNEFWIGLINGNRAKIYRAQGFITMAIQNLKQDFAISIKSKEWSSANSSATTLADIYIDEKKLSLAKLYLDTAASLMKYITSTRRKLAVAKTKAKYYERSGDLSNSLKMQKEVILLNDSLMVERERVNMAKFSARYELEKKQTEITALQHSNEIQQTKIDNQRVIIWSTGIILGLVVLLVLVIIRDSYRMKAQYAVISLQRKEIENKNEELEAQSHTLQQQNQIIGSINLQLEEKVKERTDELNAANQELDRFLYHASHDIRRPIATLLGLEQVFQLSGRETWQVLFEKVSDTAHSMDSMLYKLHMAYELNRPTGERNEIDLHEIINETTRVFNSEFQRRNIDLVNVRGASIVISSNKELLNVIFRNLIENAISFRRPHLEERPFVRIRSYIRDNTVMVDVEDNGIGIDPKHSDRIFDLYFRGTQQSKGNGVGLYLAKKAVTMLGGVIEVKSEWGTGSVFSVHLPLR
ncbi:MAG: hypothetical protein DI538_06560 [Azospira oryzae]|nr:MAG: hypothetical protein DI538_06560 [Azospira oryzae]